ncbi:hypothetical protein FK545_11805 [Planococcus glaciei]|nr:hypothetical protein [Planococcus glaciei]QDY45871.1 hypothetical protein FK545_11805 [Planococcus glaciei]
MILLKKSLAVKRYKTKIYQYEIEQFRLFQLMILRQQGDQVAVEAFYQTHRAYPYIRKAEVERAMEAGEFEQAVRLCKESELVDSDLAGLVLDWKRNVLKRTASLAGQNIKLPSLMNSLLLEKRIIIMS